MATEISQEAAIDVAWRTPRKPFNFFSCRPRPTYLPRGDRVAIRPHMQRVCGPSAEVSARTRASSRIAGRHHFRRSRPRHRNIIPRSPPIRRASPPSRARAPPTRAKRLLGARRRSAGVLSCARERYPVARGSCLAPRAEPGARIAKSSRQNRRRAPCAAEIATHAVRRVDCIAHPARNRWQLAGCSMHILHHKNSTSRTHNPGPRPQTFTKN